MLAFDDYEVHTIGTAFDRAWDRYLRTGMLSPANLHDSREILAGRILRAAQFGELDPWHLARDAVAHLVTVQHGGHVRQAPSRRRRVRAQARRR
jgi:hypothetical protein